MSKFIIAAKVDNQIGVLTRVTGLFTRRGFNIDTLTVGETENPESSRITITMTGDEYARDQMINQLKKLVNVKKVEILEPEATKRELMLIKVRHTAETRTEIMTAVDVFRAKVVDYSANEMCIEVTGDSAKVDAFVALMKPFEIMEMCRTGVVALDRGGVTLLNK
ncbi:MAG: acetolactate synthase small subunit [Clostridia bacterium]|nr:acetolactate synthase small subunit [Clostridia bacterium]